MQELEVLRQHVESLGLDSKAALTQSDVASLCESLRDSDELGLAEYVERLASPDELLDLIVNTLYA